jgi:hypothetical protein
MRSSLRSILLIACIALAGSHLARADIITLSISELASGTVGSQSFSNQLLTFTGSFTSAQLAACQVSTTFNCVNSPNEIFFELMNGLTTTITIGSSTYDGTGRDYFLFSYDGNLDSIVPLDAGDFDGFLVVPTPPGNLNSGCYMNFPSFYCPTNASTSGGELILTGVGDTYSTEVLINGVPLAPSAVPEPSSLTLLATGIFGLSGYLRRRQPFRTPPS